MKNKRSTTKILRREVKDVKPPTQAEMKRLLDRMDKPVDTSEIPEWTPEQWREASERRKETLRRKRSTNVA